MIPVLCFLKKNWLINLIEENYLLKIEGHKFSLFRKEI